MILLLLILPVMIIPVAFADSITIQTDKTFYSEDETIVISGNVTNIIGSKPIVIQIIHEATYVHLSQVEVAQDGSFTQTVIAEGALWGNFGKYTVRASYQDRIAETGFNYNLGTLCGVGTLYNTTTNSCVLITNEQPSSDESNSLCGARTHYNATTNSCVFNTGNIPETELQTNSISTESINEIPSWVKAIFAWYGEGKINDSELVQAIKFLVDNKIIVIE